MTIEETRELLFNINACYPQWNPDDPEQVVIAWHKQLKDVSLEAAESELARYIQSDKGVYPPSVSVLIPKSQEIYGFRGRVYSHEFFEELEKEATEQWQEK